ncbi:tannase/feruloyl esterase family alpha/beta hydrolase [Gilliamella sp. B2840]|uniref:tannase/feruloyl esterase family alpha/beta hydrolase n=1 Tax=unclassified Gilliamella TaxID=2685620 RepID=UPI00226A9449|nr:MULTISPECIES: tannase/feruloyl esterase family alpha/beta hydrolase [unclassified Gilliamella]MCX8657102.1 tannase/feruloyl esterase family alpha/beta hydrolase [Gilliamella sp. B2894]MCX8665826.1 tannase/feruloyl esterase family alpha/beta hydrolase [Gilliamella sp. B2887]MCX8693826.1 tannase/feruloyl esterase family alpha/beta hydrolase [Gilliamella sp. B2881]MCX8696984.1 tannase/feruloyl esterase family alpha/beta hydrolase [Gilliamella sp. B2828]MCX8698090.1 tannase/feruloyl esterase fa
MMKCNLFFLSVLSCLGASAYATPVLWDSAVHCQSLRNLELEGAKVVNTELIEEHFIPSSKLADTLRGAKTKEFFDLPEICRVELMIEPAINVEIWLPSQWNHRLQSIGGGGYAGFIPFDKLAVAAKHGYVAAATDTGHEGSLFDGKFVFKEGKLQVDSIADFAYRSVHEMTIKTKHIIESYYGQAPDYSYWNGCSTGGRQGLMEAQRYPTDYDGLYIVAPAIYWDKFIPAEIWPQVVMQEELGRPIESSKLDEVRKAIIKFADEKDGIKDDIVNDPTTLQISDVLLNQAGLNKDEIRTLRKIWQGPTDQNGKPLWFSIEPTAPLDVLAGNEGPFPIPVDYLKYWIKQNPNFEWKSLGYNGFENYFDESVKMFAPIMGTDNPDLSQFNKSGGKMIIWHGLNDRLIAPKGTIQYYNNVLKVMGGKDYVDNFAKLYLAPGVDHCNGGEGPDDINGFESLVNWVEKKQAPRNLIAKKIENGQVTLQRPICQYPQQTLYKGKGDTNNLDNYICE